MLLRGLNRLEEEAKQDFEGWTPRYTPGSSVADAAAEIHAERTRLERRYYGLSTAAINRRSAVASGAEPITDFTEASRLVAEVLAALDAPDSIDRVLHLVGRIQ